MEMEAGRTLDLISGTNNIAPLNPIWAFENQVDGSVMELQHRLAIPVNVENLEAVELTSVIVFIFRAAFKLNDVFGARSPGDSGRSLAEDQKAIYEQLAASLSAVGVDGRKCLLRFVCEAQNSKIQKLNLLGKMLATLLTPKEDSFLEEYNMAAELGKAGECAGNFDKCPISLFHIFNFAKKTSKKVSKKDKVESSKTKLDEVTQELPAITVP